MFSVVKPEIKITEKDIETVPEIWIEKINAQFYLVYPLVSSNEEFLKYVSELKKPSPGWKKIKCQVLLSRFKTYQLAKSSEDSITRNQKRMKKTVEKSGTTRKSKAIPPVVKENEFYTKVEVDEMIQKGIREALAKHWQDMGSGVDVNNSTDTVVHEPQMTEATVQEATVENVNVQEATVEYVTVEEATVEYVTVEEATVEYVTVQEATVDEATLPEATLPEATVNEARMNAPAEGIAEVEIKFPIDSPLDLNELNFTMLSNNFTFYEDKFSKKGAEKMSTTMVIVSNQVIKDSYLKTFSYKGKSRNGKKKDAFQIYENVENLIVSATMKAYNNFNVDVESFVPATKKELLEYFRLEHIKFAEQRVNRKSKKKK